MGCHEQAIARARILATVATIPAGEIRSYGQIARCVYGTSRKAQPVASCISAAYRAGRDFSWHRVVRANGSLSPKAPSDQRQRLEQEDVIFDENGRVSETPSAEPLTVG